MSSAPEVDVISQLPPIEDQPEVSKSRLLAGMSDLPDSVPLDEVKQTLPRSDSALFIITKDRSHRLEANLSLWSNVGLPIVLIDDSCKKSEARKARRISSECGVIYHGVREQETALSGISSELTEQFIIPLGRPGWTLGLCRNYSLLLGLREGYKRILLVDDDMAPIHWQDAHTSLSLLSRFDFVGARTVGFPDDSVVGHIARSLGVVQYDFITGQYLALKTGIREYFFPHVYDEDLIFLLLQIGPRKAARWGRVLQATPHPLGLTTGRAIDQETGETQLEGCIQQNASSRESNVLEESFWIEILEIRRATIGDLIEKARLAGRPQIVRALSRVLSYSKGLDPRSFADYHQWYERSKGRWVALQENFLA